MTNFAEMDYAGNEVRIHFLQGLRLRERPQQTFTPSSAIKEIGFDLPLHLHVSSEAFGIITYTWIIVIGHG